MTISYSTWYTICNLISKSPKFCLDFQDGLEFTKFTPIFLEDKIYIPTSSCSCELKH